jgi:hypothetical protein
MGRSCRLIRTRLFLGDHSFHGVSRTSCLKRAAAGITCRAPRIRAVGFLAYRLSYYRRHHRHRDLGVGAVPLSAPLNPPT